MKNWGRMGLGAVALASLVGTAQAENTGANGFAQDMDYANVLNVVYLLKDAEQPKDDAGLRRYLGDTPDGWARIEIESGNDVAVQITSVDPNLPFSATNNVAASGWLYQKGDDRVAVTARMSNGIVPDVEIMHGVALVNGVPFVELASDSPSLRHVAGVFGTDQEMFIEVVANVDASDETLFALIEGINFTALNYQLEQPAAHVGQRADVEINPLLAKALWGLRDTVRKARADGSLEALLQLDAGDRIASR